MNVTDAMASIGQNLQDYKDRTGMSDKQLASRMGIDRKQVCNIRNQKYDSSYRISMNLRTALMIAETLGISVSELIGEREGNNALH